MMKISQIHCSGFLVSWIFFMGLVQITFAQKKDYSDISCIINSALPPQEKGNYVDCTTDQMKAEGKTKCCKQDTTVGCCTPGGSWTMMIVICCIIGGVTVALAIFCFITYWFDEDTFPCLAKNKCYQRMKRTTCCDCFKKRRERKEQERLEKEKNKAREEQVEREKKARAIQKRTEKEEDEPFTDIVQDDFFQ